MKKLVYLATLALLFACTSEENGDGTQNNPDELTITGEVLDITDHSAMLTGYVNLPLEFGDSEVGIMYDTGKTFEDTRKAVATELNGNNKFTVTVNGLLPSTTYYYKSYVQKGMAVKYGAVKTFATIAQRVTSISLDKTSLSLIIGEEATVTVTRVLPDNAEDKSYTWSSSDSSIASVDNCGKVQAKSIGKTTIKATANDGSGVFANCVIIVKGTKAEGAVDLGLSVYWAESNLSTSGLCAKPEEYGDYYAWGETEPKSDYSWSTYKLGSGDLFSKYNDSDKTTLDLEDDAAHVNLGGKWRMPTEAEWVELIENCTWVWVDDYNGTGVAGRIVTSDLEGYKDKSIFLPAAGDLYPTNLNWEGSRGTYWSSSVGTDHPNGAWRVDFYYDIIFRDNDGRYRCYGRSVRPVTE